MSTGSRLKRAMRDCAMNSQRKTRVPRYFIRNQNDPGAGPPRSFAGASSSRAAAPRATAENGREKAAAGKTLLAASVGREAILENRSGLSRSSAVSLLGFDTAKWYLVTPNWQRKKYGPPRRKCGKMQRLAVNLALIFLLVVLAFGLLKSP